LASLNSPEEDTNQASLSLDEALAVVAPTEDVAPSEQALDSEVGTSAEPSPETATVLATDAPTENSSESPPHD
jgi:hypothetical protein